MADAQVHNFVGVLVLGTEKKKFRLMRRNRNSIKRNKQGKMRGEKCHRPTALVTSHDGLREPRSRKRRFHWAASRRKIKIPWKCIPMFVYIYIYLSAISFLPN
jgi:hypothetical protein